jgi:hypothetical protein
MDRQSHLIGASRFGHIYFNNYERGSPMEIDPTELSRPDNKLMGLYKQFVRSACQQQQKRLYQRIMDAPAYSIHSVNIKAQAMAHTLNTQPVDRRWAVSMLGMLAG